MLSLFTKQCEFTHHPFILCSSFFYFILFFCVLLVLPKKMSDGNREKRLYAVCNEILDRPDKVREHICSIHVTGVHLCGCGYACTVQLEMTSHQPQWKLKKNTQFDRKFKENAFGETHRKLRNDKKIAKIVKWAFTWVPLWIIGQIGRISFSHFFFFNSRIF